MMENKKNYFDKAYALLGKWLTPSYEELLERFELYPEDCTVEQAGGYTYILFCYPLLQGKMEQGILLVYDGDTVIADLAFYHAHMKDVLSEKSIYDYMSEDSDWSYLQHYIVCNYFHPETEYPCQEETNLQQEEVLFFTNIYVTKRYRKQGIFRIMHMMSMEQVLRYETEAVSVISCISLDPDIACYGEDTPQVPYRYSMKDEQDRMRNKVILESMGYVVLKLEEDHPEENLDGTKRWFAVREARERVVEVEEI